MKVTSFQASCEPRIPDSMPVPRRMSLYASRTPEMAVLKEIKAWTDSKDEKCKFWLNGIAGTGKSTVVQITCDD